MAARPGNRARRTTAVALATVAVLLGTAGTASAGGDGPSSGRHHRGDGAPSLCKRAGKIDRRIDRALKRLDGKAHVRGSIARLEERVDRAKQRGHDEIATYLKHRLSFRKSLVGTLKERKEDLAEVREWCEKNDMGRGA